MKLCLKNQSCQININVKTYFHNINTKTYLNYCAKLLCVFTNSNNLINEYIVFTSCIVLNRT